MRCYLALIPEGDTSGGFFQGDKSDASRVCGCSDNTEQLWTVSYNAWHIAVPNTTYLLEQTFLRAAFSYKHVLPEKARIMSIIHEIIRVHATDE